MKRAVIAALALSLLLAVLTACGAEARQPDEPAPQVRQDEPAETEPPANPKEDETDSAKAKEDEEHDAKLSIVYQAAYDGAVTYVSESLEDQLAKEVRDLKTLAGGFAKLPENYPEDYKAWRIENCGTDFKQAAKESEAPAPDETGGGQQQADFSFLSADETLYATGAVNLRSGPGTSFDRLGSLSAGDSVHRVGIGTGTADGWSRIQLGDGTFAFVSSSYLSYDKPVVQQSSGGSQQDTIDPDLEAKLAALGGFSGPSEHVNPNEGRTESDLQQGLEDSYNTEFRINGT